MIITGSTGMVGRNLLKKLNDIGQIEVLAPSRQELNLLDRAAVEKYFETHKPDFVIHLAATVGGIQANINQPVKFLADNSYVNLNVITASQKFGVENLLYLGSSCMYPKDRNLLPESDLLDGKLEPTNEGYALAKVMGGLLCNYISSQYSYNYKTIVPSNLYGPYDNFDPVSSHMIPGVIRKLHEAKLQNLSEVSIWGDGTARREFMYVDDLVDFILFAIDNIGDLPEMVNVGLGHDYTINEYYQAIAEIVGYQGQFVHDLDKPAGMKRKLLDSSKAHALGWQAQTDLQTGLNKTYDYFLTLENNSNE